MDQNNYQPKPKAGRSVAGRTVLITGGGSGMGRATALLFASEGAQVAVTDINADGAKAVTDQITQSGGTAQSWPLDVADQSNIIAVVDAVAEQFGGIDMLINNAGIAEPLALDDPGYDAAWARIQAVILTGAQQMIAAALPHLRASDCARVVNIASTEALGATAGHSNYSAAKAGLTGLTRGLAVELGREGITVNAICPGPINTGMTEAISNEHKTIYAKRRTAMGRYGEPKEIAHMVLSLCLPGASFVTGVSLPVDGGLMARNA